MAQERSVASQYVMVAVALLCLVASYEIVDAATHVVGESDGWTFDVFNWTEGRNFSAGDVLVFQYNPKYHNVVLVEPEVVYSCDTTKAGKVYQSGHDHFTLSKGQTCFISTFVGDCANGMRLAAVVE